MATNNNPAGSTAPTTRTGQAGAASPDLKGDANELMNEAKAAAGKIADEAKEQVSSLADRAKAEVGEATDKARSLASDQKDVIAEQVGGVAEAIGKAADDLEQKNGSSAHYARLIADNAEKLSSTIRDKNVDELLSMAQDFGRKQPALFMGAAALLGFAASRFVMASANRSQEQATDTGSSTYQEYAGEPASNGKAPDAPDAWTTGGM